MLLLVGNTAKVNVVTGAAVTVDAHADLVDIDASGNVTESTKNTAITGAATTDVTGSPAAGSTRNVRTLNVANKHATSSVVVTVQHTDGTTAVQLYTVTLLAGQTLYYVDGVGWALAPSATSLVAAYASLQASPADPVGNATVTLKMAGLAQTITPAVSGRLLVYIGGILTNSTALAGDGATCRIAYGTGAAPANAAAATGTLVGPTASMRLERATASDEYAFGNVAVITGLTLGTAYWIDLQLAALSAGTGLAKSLGVTAHEF